MKLLFKNRKKIIVILSVLILIATYSLFNNKTQLNEYAPIKVLATNTEGTNFIGNSSCFECHQDIVKNHLQTAHFKTSAIATEETIKGSFEKNKNEYHLNDDIMFRMISNKQGQFQEAYSKKYKNKIYAFRFDFTIGSGTKGQTYLTWLNDGLFQQQISYYSELDEWINSPMYPNGKFVEPRPIISQCIGCHSTYAKSLSSHPLDNRFYKNQMVLGIDCERCHGPAEVHVVNARKEKLTKENLFIKSFKKLSRQQRLDACALCHSGLNDKTKNGVLNFEIGDKLNHNPTEIAKNEDLDVHGNQYGLLIQSKCFTKSKSMDCNTCHDVHKNERGLTDYFNKKCMNCHKMETVIHKDNSINFTALNCVSCHMPTKASKSLLITNKKNLVTPLVVRTHLIKIYE